MARPRPIDTRALADDLGRSLGAALAEGLAAGLSEALAQVQAELGPLGEELARSLVEQARPDAGESAASLTAEGLRVCGEPSCGRRAIARGFCRRHYARMVYQERKVREGREPAPRRARTRSAEPIVVEAPKVVSPVAPIVRRRPSEGAEVVAAAPVPAPRANPAVTPESVARFFGLSD